MGDEGGAPAADVKPPPEVPRAALVWRARSRDSDNFVATTLVLTASRLFEPMSQVEPPSASDVADAIKAAKTAPSKGKCHHTGRAKFDEWLSIFESLVSLCHAMQTQATDEIQNTMHVQSLPIRARVLPRRRRRRRRRRLIETHVRNMSPFLGCEKTCASARLEFAG